MEEDVWMSMEHRVEHHRYWLNYLLCWHGKRNMRLEFSNNGVVSYCHKCRRKKLGIYDFGTEGFYL